MAERLLMGAMSAALLALGGCGSESTRSPQAATDAGTPAAAAPPSPTTAAARPEAEVEDDPVAGSVVRFSSSRASVDVTITKDTPAARDLLSMLPLQLELEEFNGREKVADLPRELDFQDTPGADPEDGDLIYFKPWGNLGFYYDASGIGPSADVIRLGTYQASRAQLAELEGQAVRAALR